MKRLGMTQPPKKKHPKRPREPAPIRIPRDVQLSKARAEFEKAATLLQEAESAVAKGGLPNAAVHLGYYAMHHCAIAALLVAGGVDKYGDVPRSHEHIATHFGILVAAREGLEHLGPKLRKAMDARMGVDYDTAYRVSAADAAELAGTARQFLEACKAGWKA